MTVKKQAVEELLGYNKFNVDEENAHIVIDKEICAKCKTKPCLVACPAVLYRQQDEKSDVTFDYAGCLECGTCRVVCYNQGNKGIVKWVYPNGTFGISYRHG
ncbi:MAG: 4Fe-4S dicluster domain-containing protein [Sporomusaceae bacterium]|nr:4Fe-4S dicluster domain-containing protein [Sporomusaceae bacterium]